MYLSNLSPGNFELCALCLQQVGHRQNDKVCNTFFFNITVEYMYSVHNISTTTDQKLNIVMLPNSYKKPKKSLKQNHTGFDFAFKGYILVKILIPNL